MENRTDQISNYNGQYFLLIYIIEARNRKDN